LAKYRYFWGILKTSYMEGKWDQKKKNHKISRIAFQQTNNALEKQKNGSIKLTRQSDSGAATNLNCLCIGMGMRLVGESRRKQLLPPCSPWGLKSSPSLHDPGTACVQP
jgi:hypothetical protein